MSSLHPCTYKQTDYVIQKWVKCNLGVRKVPGGGSTLAPSHVLFVLRPVSVRKVARGGSLHWPSLATQMRCGLGPTNDFPGRIPALDISQVSTGLTRCDLNEFFHVYEGSREDIYYGLKCSYSMYAVGSRP